MNLFWCVLKIVFDDEYDPLYRIWIGFSWGWTFVIAYIDSLRPDYNPANVPPMQILWSIWPWFAGPVLMYAIRFLITGSFRPPKE